MSKIGAPVLVLLLVSLFLRAAPVAAGALSWSAEPVPGTADEVLGPVGVDVRDIAVGADKTTIYAVPGESVSDNVVYKSVNAGLTWQKLSVAIQPGLVAVAPDNPNFVAIASKTAEVCISADGGLTWVAPGIPRDEGGAAAAAIFGVAVSPAVGGAHWVAVAGKEAGDVANLWYCRADSAALLWKETGSLAGFSSASAVKAVAFSPDFPSDGIIVVVGESNGVSINFEILSLSDGRWNTSAGFTGYPVTLVSNGDIDGLTSASMSLAPDYTGSDESRRIAFVGLALSGDATTETAGGIHRLEDNRKKELVTGVNIHSLGFNGSSLVAGAYDSNTVYRSADPLAVMPTLRVTSSLKEPGGENRVVVAWAGDKVVAGTSGNESAFAVSGNGGVTFNDASLIDTSTTYTRDVAVSADGGTVYLVTDDGSDLSLWRRSSSWERVLSRQGTADYLVRLAPDSGTVYVAKKGGRTIYHNGERGEAGWLTGTCGVEFQDLTVASADVAYALSGEGEVSRSTDAGASWMAAVSTGLDRGATIFSTGEGTVLAGSRDGYVAYSLDGNSPWIKIPKEIQRGAGNVQVVADKDFATNRIIYAASDAVRQNIARWKIGSSTAWSYISGNIESGGIYGLSMEGGTLYALEYSQASGQSTLWQCLSPATAASTSTSDWASLKATGTTTDTNDRAVHFNAAPRALKESAGGKLWAVKINGTGRLYSFNDFLTTLKLMSPPSGFTTPVNSRTGVADEMVFSWSRPDTATRYEMDIAYDENFARPFATISVASGLPTVALPLGPERTGDARVNFAPGAYYWRVKVVQPSYTPYSLTRSFTVASLVVPVAELLAPANGSTGISRTPSFSWSPAAGATEYRFVLAVNAALDKPVVDVRVQTSAYALTAELDYSRTYFWAVRSTAPAQGEWSAVANFTVKEKPAEPTPPIVIQQAPPPVIEIPQPAPAEIVISTPAAPSAPAAPAYIWAVIVIGAVLMAGVVYLIVSNFGVGWVYGRGRRFRGGRPISFAVESFLWMLASGERGDGERLLSAKEEEEMGQILVSRIRGLATDGLLYSSFPRNAALFLRLWSQYGSREETNRYLARSFKSGKDNVIKFLKCYLPASESMEAGLPDFTRTQYDAIARVVDADVVLKALKKLYGDGLMTTEDEGPGASPDKNIAHQFANIHLAIKNETKTDDKAGTSDLQA